MTLKRQKTPATVAVLSLMIVFAGELWLSARGESQTFDEGAHIYAGYSYWTRSDFGMNPEHPPLVKLLAALPLLPLRLRVPPIPITFFRSAPYLGGYALLYLNDAGILLLRARAAVSVFALAQALLVFAAGAEMFGFAAGLVSLILVVFEPNILGNGPLVGTDMGVTCCLFAAVYAFYRYVERPSPGRLAACGIVAGFALAAKHSGALIFPVLVLLAIVEFGLRRRSAESGGGPASEARRISREALRLAGALAAIAVMSLAALWIFYGLRFRARPGGLELNPPLQVYVKTLNHPLEAGAIITMAHLRLLPEAYLYGLADVMLETEQGRPSFLLGRLYPRGPWFYFPAALAMKCTVGFLVLFLLMPFARIVRGPEKRREVLFLAIPAVLYFGVSLTSRLDIGIRHILPVFPFLIVLTGAAAWGLMKRSRPWAAVVSVLLVFHAASSLRAFPAYLAYSNELWGGPRDTYKVLADSNVGWGGGLEAVGHYVREHGIANCWFAYAGTGDPAYYHIPCKPLPTFASGLNGYQGGPVPVEISGPIFVSAIALTGLWSGPGKLNPYEAFRGIRPSDILRGEILVYDGHFLIPAVSALSDLELANRLAAAGRFDQALGTTQDALTLDPDSVAAHLTRSSLLTRLKRPVEALVEYERAMSLARTQYPEFQKGYLTLAPPKGQ